MGCWCWCCAPTIVSEPGILEFDDPQFKGADDDATLTNLMNYAQSQTYKPTIRLRYGRTDFRRVHVPYTGFALIGAGGPVAVEQVRGGNPFASFVKVSLSGNKFLFDLPGRATHRVTIQGISWEGNSGTCWLGSSHSGVLWTSTLRDLAFSAFQGVLGGGGKKLLNTAILTDGWWNINNGQGVSIHLGGSDSILWAASNFLLDSPTKFTSNIPHHMLLDWQEKTVVGGGFITGEGVPAALCIKGGNSSGGLIISGLRAEGRNTSKFSNGSVIRQEGGRVTYRDCWISYGYGNPGASGRPDEGGVVTVLKGGRALFDACWYSRAAPVPETTPWIYASGAGTKVRVRNAETAFDGGAWTGVPRVSAVNGAARDIDNSVI